MKAVLINLKSIVVLLALVLGTSAAVAGEYPDLTVDELHAAIEANSVVVLDANGSARYASGHIPGAIDSSKVEDWAAVLPADKDTLIVAYCGGPRCSAYMRPASVAKEMGYTNVKHLSAGISGWKAAGKPVETPSN